MSSAARADSSMAPSSSGSSPARKRSRAWGCRPKLRMTAWFFDSTWLTTVRRETPAAWAIPSTVMSLIARSQASARAASRCRNSCVGSREAGCELSPRINTQCRNRTRYSFVVSAPLPQAASQSRGIIDEGGAAAGTSCHRPRSCKITRANPGRSVTMPSTPRSMRRTISSGSLTVHTCTARPAR